MSNSQNLNKLCHSLGSLEAQLVALNANFVHLQEVLRNLSDRVGAIERRNAFWQGKIAGLAVVMTFIGYVLSLVLKG